MVFTQPGNPAPSPPRKMIAAILWLVLFGGVAVGAHFFFADPGEESVPGEIRTVVSAGPIPMPPVAGDILVGPGEPVVPLMVAGERVEPHEAIEDPGGLGMVRFASDVAEMVAGIRKTPVRILHYGDSILTTDEMSGQVRRNLQNLFGDGGHGFVLMGRPWRWYKHLGVDHGARGKWRVRPFTSDPLEDGLYGLGGVAFQASRGSHGRAWAGTVDEGDHGRTVESFDLSYLEQPSGGSFELILNGSTIETVSTAATEKRVVHRMVTNTGTSGKLEIEYNNDGPLRVFGVVLESGKPGIVYDSLAINGARASALGRFDSAHWGEELRRRTPSLVMLMMGANEGANRFLVLREYKRHLSEILKTIKKSLPESSVLVVGAMDQAKKNPDGTLSSKRMPKRLSEAQREVALETGCAFFDTWRAMGGDGSMATWYRRGLGGGDMIHPTENGARKIGNWLSEAIIHSYQSHQDKQNIVATGPEGTDSHVGAEPAVEDPEENR